MNCRAAAGDCHGVFVHFVGTDVVCLHNGFDRSLNLLLLHGKAFGSGV